MIRLTEGEWAILEVLWSGERFPLGEIVSALRPKMNWRRNTVHTYLTRMESKGIGENSSGDRTPSVRRGCEPGSVCPSRSGNSCWIRYTMARRESSSRPF